MSTVRVLVGTRKGAFLITSDGARRDWRVAGPLFGGWQVMHVHGSPADPDRLYASQWTDWHGQVIQRSVDGGRTWEPVGNAFAYAGETGTHQWYDGTPHPWEFNRVWHLEPSPDDPDTVFAGVEDAGALPLHGRRRHLDRAAGPAHPRDRRPLGARRRRPLPAHDHHRPGRPAADVRRDLGRRCLPQRGRRRHLAASPPAVCGRSSCPTPRPRSATASTTSRCTPPARTRCSCRSTGTSAAATTPATAGPR